MATLASFDRLISFPSVHYAIRAERLLEELGIAIIALPTPREIDISCGQCILFLAADQQEVLSSLAQGDAVWSKLYSRSCAGKVYEKIADYGG